MKVKELRVGHRYVSNGKYIYIYEGPNQFGSTLYDFTLIGKDDKYLTALNIEEVNKLKDINEFNELERILLE